MSIFYKDDRLTHMQQGDAYLWQKFTEQHPNYFKSVSYDQRVGEGVKLNEKFPIWLQKTAMDLSQKRIDVVGQTSKATYIVEVRVRAKAAVIGTLLTYRFLYITSYGQAKPVIPMLITDEVDADLLITLNEIKMLFFIV
jgi:hypothetical protein